ncbi:MAG: TetR/AcrR family transcriptional regulator, partial [Caldilinea sp.]|nr:TetR/AcrR family transcriptional regulator [Caldilinea sp.]MDW8439694.1 TetR/AcrR family transcriptional regulator [Caldilineaceae bacterium]
VYQYFPDKEEIAWALFQRIFEQWSAVSQTLPIVGNGYQKLEFLVMQNIENFEANRHHLRFIVEFDALYARQAGAERVRRILEGIKIGSKEWVAQTIRQGIADGSIRPDVEPELTAAALMNLLSGMNGRFALLGDLVAEEYGAPTLTIYREICRTFLRGIQSTSQPNV